MSMKDKLFWVIYDIFILSNFIHIFPNPEILF